jgi:DNA end-binding protein Ku
MRSIWSGSISFGLINIPVKIYSASEERALKFHLLDKHGHHPISYLRVHRGTNEEVPYSDIVKGYEYQKGDYVVLTDDDFKKVAPKKTQTIDIVSFVDEKEVPSVQIDKPYYIEPDKKAEKAYVLLREALKRAGKVGIAKWVLRNKERIAMVRPQDKALMLIQLRYQDEVRDPEDLHIPDSSTFSKRELEMALMLINQLQEHFKASEYKDTYTDELKKIIAKKAKGKPIRVEAEPEVAPTDMRNLMEALRKSLEAEQHREPAHAR